MRSSMKNHIIDTLMKEWGVSKILQIILLAIAAASITIVIGANMLPNQTTLKGELSYE